MTDEDRKQQVQSFQRAIEKSAVQEYLHFQFSLERLSKIPCPVEYPQVSAQVKQALSQFEAASSGVDIALHAHFLWKAQEYDKAEARLEEAVSKDGNSVQVRTIAGEYFKWKREYTKAKEHLDIASSRCGGDANYEVLYGEACLLAGDQEKAAEVFEPLLNASEADQSKWNETTFALCGWYIMETKARWANAMFYFERIRDVANYKCNLLFAEWSRRTSHYKVAAMAFEDVLRLVPGDQWARVRLAYCYWRLNQKSDCLLQYEIMSKQNPESVDTLLAYADMLRLTERYEEAQALFGRAKGILGEWEWIRVREIYCEIFRQPQRTSMEGFFEAMDIYPNFGQECSGHKDDWNQEYMSDLKIIEAIYWTKSAGYSYDFPEGDPDDWDLDATFLQTDLGITTYAGLKLTAYRNVMKSKVQIDDVMNLKKVLAMEPTDGRNWLAVARAAILQDDFEDCLYHLRVALVIAQETASDLPIFLKECLMFAAAVHFHYKLFDLFDDGLSLTQHELEDDKELLVWRAFIHIDECDVEAATDYLDQAESGLSDDVAYLLLLCRGRMSLSNYDGGTAVKWANEMIALNGDRPEGHAMLARANSLVNPTANLEVIKESCNSAMQKINEISGMSRLIHWVYAQVIASHVECGGDSLEIAKNLAGRWQNSQTGTKYDYQVWTFVGMMYGALGEDDEALKHFAHALRVNRRHFFSRWKLGQYYLKRSQNDLAKRCLVNALQVIETNDSNGFLQNVQTLISQDLQKC